MKELGPLPYETLVEHNTCGIYRSTPAGDILFCNQSFARMLGYDAPADLIGKDAATLYFDLQERKTFIDRLVVERELHNHQATLQKKDGSFFYAWENVRLHEEATGKLYLDGVVIDIAAELHAMAALQKSEQKFRQIVETAQEGIWMLDGDDKTIFTNPKICEMLGYTAEEMTGKRLYDFMDEEGEAYARACMERRRSGVKENLDIRYVTKTGADIWCNISTTPILNEAGRYNGALAMITDITDRRKEAVEKEELIANLSERNKGLGQFTYIVSHNLRAPVANILSLVNLLEDAPPDTAGKLVKGIRDSATALDTIITDLHEILRVKNGSFQQKEYVIFKDLIKSITGSINFFIHEHHAVIEENFSVVEGVVTVRSYLHSIFYNFITNSIKYANPAVPPVIKIESARKNGYIVLVFSDNGKGMDMQRVGKDLFGLYKRFDASAEGKGMGLFMVKAQVESLGGSIAVQSEVGKGTTFTILIPG